MPESPRRNPFFPLAALLSALFVVTILALVATLFGDPHAPAARLVERYAGLVLTVEVLSILATGGLALAVDRRQTLAARQNPGAAPSIAGEGPAAVGDPSKD